MRERSMAPRWGGVGLNYNFFSYNRFPQNIEGASMKYKAFYLK